MTNLNGKPGSGMDKQAASKRILLCVTGLSPQIVTETLYALARVRDPAWIPHEVRLVTTATGKREAELNLLTGRQDGPGWFHRLCADYALPRITFDSGCFHVPRDASGIPLDDIRSPADNELAADFITGIVRDLTRDLATELHVSMAGGRKTMGYYLGYALSLYGRPQDRLSHVLVSEPFENNRAFFYPTPGACPIPVLRGGKEQTFDAREARVDLAEIPFFRMREDLPKRLLDGHSTFSQVVALANRGLGEPRLTLNTATRQAWADGELLDLSNTEFILMLWLAQRARSSEPAVDWGTREASRDFLAVAASVLNPNGGEYERMENALAQCQGVAIRIGKYFEPHKSRINSGIRDALGRPAAARYVIERSRQNTGARYHINLSAEQIEIAEGPAHA
jgi:CRISPR-associated protein (TIGR02584 family)